MEYEIVELQGKEFVGVLDCLANNDVEMAQKIGKIWDEVFSENLQEKVENKCNDFPICLYSDYGNPGSVGEVLEYDVLVGYEVRKNSYLGKEYVKKTILAGKYARFLVKGNITESVGKAWDEIWATPLDRSYTGDFERYLNEDMENAEVEIYIALKE